MSGIITIDGANFLLSLLTASDNPTDNLYVALISGAQPGITSAGSELDEPAFDDYARAVYENISGNWFVMDGLLVNQNEIGFPVAVQDWGNIGFWALCDSDFSGRVFFVGDCDLRVVSGDQVVLAPGALSISVPTSTWREEE